MGDARTLIGKHQARGVLVDANLLVLLLVGRTNPARIQTFKRTSNFTVSDFLELERLLEWFGSPILATPLIFSQLSDLTDLPGRERGIIRQRVKEIMEVAQEHFDPAKQLVNHALFLRLGLADAAIATVCERNILVLTADLQLQVALTGAGLDALNFNQVRPLGWRASKPDFSP